jgi:pyruvate-formate lyase-activating enzyme
MPKELIKIEFRRKDWEEIFYALESKAKMIELGYYGPETREGENEDWIEHLTQILAVIERKLLPFIPHGVKEWRPPQ